MSSLPGGAVNANPLGDMAVWPEILLNTGINAALTLITESSTRNLKPTQSILENRTSFSHDQEDSDASDDDWQVTSSDSDSSFTMQPLNPTSNPTPQSAFGFNQQPTSWVPSYHQIIMDLTKIPDKLLIDTHCHLDFIAKKFAPNEGFVGFERYVEDKFSNHVPDCFEGCIAIYCQPYQWFKFGVERYVERLHEQGHVKIHAAYGVHPHFADDFDAVRQRQLMELLQRPNVVALGEIGLDYCYKNTVDHETQKEVFRIQLKIALRKRLPVVLHIRDATEDGLEVLREAGVPSAYPLHLHCFNDSWETCQKWLDEFSGLKVGLTGLILKTDRFAHRLYEVARKLPLDRLLLETDAPYFVPECLGLQHSHPGHVSHVLAKIVELRSESLMDILYQTRMNVEEIYRIKMQEPSEEEEPPMKKRELDETAINAEGDQRSRRGKGESRRRRRSRSQLNPVVSEEVFEEITTEEDEEPPGRYVRRRSEEKEEDNGGCMNDESRQVLLKESDDEKEKSPSPPLPGRSVVFTESDSEDDGPVLPTPVERRRAKLVSAEYTSDSADE